MRQLFTIIIPALMLFYGCGKRESVLMDCIESASGYLVEDKPDSAYTVLMGLDKAVPKMTEAERMRYEVCRVSAMNKMFVSLKDEEEAMMRAVEYYEKHGNPDEKMNACLLLGSVYRDMGDAPQALEWFDKAIIHGEKGTDKTQLAKIHGQKADLFVCQNLFKEALVELEFMSGIAKLLHDKELLINALSFKTTVFEEMGEKDSVLFLDKYLYNVYIKDLNDTVSAVTGMASSIPILMEKGDLKEASHFLQLYKNKSKRFESNGKVKVGFESVYSMYADFYLAQNQMDSAQIYYRNTANSLSWNNKTIGYYGLMRTFEKMGKSDSVVKYSILTCEAYNKLFNELQTNTLQQIEATYNYGRYKQESAEKALEAERARNFTYLLISVLVVSLGIISFAWYRWRNKKRQELETIKSNFEQSKSEALQLSASRKELTKQLEEKNAIIEQLSASAIDSDVMSELDELRRETDCLRSALQDAERRYKNILERGDNNIVPSLLLKIDSGETKLSNREWEDLEIYVTKIYPSFLTNLFKVLPGLKKDHVHIAILVKLGFTPTQMNLLLCLSIQAISNARRRMYERAHKGLTATAELADEWIKGL